MNGYLRTTLDCHDTTGDCSPAACHAVVLGSGMYELQILYATSTKVMRPACIHDLLGFSRAPPARPPHRYNFAVDPDHRSSYQFIITA